MRGASQKHVAIQCIKLIMVIYVLQHSVEQSAFLSQIKMLFIIIITIVFKLCCSISHSLSCFTYTKPFSKVNVFSDAIHDINI